VAAEWPSTRLSARSFKMLFVRKNRWPFDQPRRPIRYQNPSASRQALKAAIREDGRPNRLELASNPAAISSGALGNRHTDLLEQNPREEERGTVRHCKLSGVSHLLVS
jgi:hypothetical protein